jgi:hypothetical protein
MGGGRWEIGRRKGRLTCSSSGPGHFPSSLARRRSVSVPHARPQRTRLPLSPPASILLSAQDLPRLWPFVRNEGPKRTTSGPPLDEDKAGVGTRSTVFETTFDRAEGRVVLAVRAMGETVDDLVRFGTSDGGRRGGRRRERDGGRRRRDRSLGPLGGRRGLGEAGGRRRKTGEGRTRRRRRIDVGSRHRPGKVDPDRKLGTNFPSRRRRLRRGHLSWGGRAPPRREREGK